MTRKTPKIGRPPAGEIEERKRTILEMATRLFIENGFEKTTVAAIGKAAGVTKRTIYEHIGDKETLFHEVCMQSVPKALELHFELRPKGKTTREALKSLAKVLLSYSLAQDTIALTRLLMAERLRFPDLVRESALAMRILFQKLIEDALQEMIELDLLPECETHKAADYFYDIVVGNVQLQMLFDVARTPPDEAETQERIEVLLHGLSGLESTAPRSGQTSST